MQHFQVCLDDIGVEALHAKLTDRDPVTAAKLRPSDPQRVLRAFEVFEATGRPLAQWQEAPTAPLLKDANIAAFVLDPPRPQLRARIAARFEAMLDGGGLDEARSLEGLDPALPAAKLLDVPWGSEQRHRHHRHIAPPAFDLLRVPERVAVIVTGNEQHCARRKPLEQRGRHLAR